MKEMQLKAKAWRMLHPFTIKNNNKQANIKQRQAKNLISMHME